MPGAAAAAESPPSSAHAPLPASLVALEQKMAQIRFNTARISERLVFGEPGSPAGGAELGSAGNESKRQNLVTVVTGAIQLSPRAAVFTSKLEVSGEVSGHPLSGEAGAETETRTIGNAHYTYQPRAARFDGGRPWVRRKVEPVRKPHGKVALFADAVAALAPTFTNTLTEAEGPFAKLIDDFGEAVSVREGGSMILDGQQVTEFTATLSLSRLFAGKLTHREQREIVRQPKRATIEIDAFIAASGLPVRTTGVFGARSDGIGIETDILGLEVPVAVQPPPADKTIAEAQLVKLERKRIHRLASKRPRQAFGAQGQLVSRPGA
ncbi:MAG TPA: hypothetical protein VNV42_00850 [Solirubrobacteraceae bacterium]|nr:hypothetical protein [Solirubrobacteraceae bacterium]